MPAVVRVGADTHIGHASPTPNPFHKTSYATGSPDVYTNNCKTVRKGDVTSCGDPAVGASPTVYANGIPVHRKTDSTGGHGSWVPNAAATGSGDVFADDAPGSPAKAITDTLTSRDKAYWQKLHDRYVAQAAALASEVGHIIDLKYHVLKDPKVTFISTCNGKMSFDQNGSRIGVGEGIIAAINQDMTRAKRLYLQYGLDQVALQEALNAGNVNDVTEDEGWLDG